MKNIFTLLALFFTVLSFKAVAQTSTTCNAKFSFVVSSDTVQFTPSSNTDSQLVYHSWNFGDGSAVQDVYAPSHIYTAAGTYSVTQYIVRLTPNKVIACSDSVTELVTINTEPCNIQPSFTWRIDTLTRTVSFINTTFLPSTLAVPSNWFFGDDSSATTWNASHTYAKPGKYYVCLRLQFGPNCVKYGCDSITIPAPVVCNIQSYFYDQADSLQSNKIHFTNETVNIVTADSSYWDFGDGTSSHDANAIHAYAQAGTYNACLTITRITVPGTAPCVSKFCRTIVIQPACNLAANFIYSKDSLSTSPYTYRFTNTSTPAKGFDSSYWNFGDGSSPSYDTNPTHTFTTAGTYTVCLYIKNAINSTTTPACESHICETVIVPPLCNIKVAYTWKIDSLNNNTIDFTNTTAIPISGSSAKWSFGDGSPIDSSWNATHTYTKAGKYYVCLRIQTNNTCVNYQCDSITVAAPVCNFQPAYTWQLDSRSQNTVDFTNTTITTVAGSKALWFYGDGTSDSTWSAVHTFAQPGKYYVCLRVQINPTCYKYQCDSITIPTPVCNLKSSYTWKIDSLNYYTVDFTNITMTTVTNASVRWSFGDGSPLDSTWNTKHSYAQAGKYYVCLRIQTSANCVSYQCDSITVPTPVCNFQPAYTWQLDSRTQNTVDFTNTTITTVAGAKTLWFFGDGTSDSSWSAVHTFAQPGKYYVCLRVQLNPTCYKYQCDSITVPTPSPACNQLSLFTFSKSSNDNQDYSFTPNYIATNIQYTWTFGDGDGTHNLITTHNYLQPGVYTACLTAYRDSNCASTTCKEIVVYPKVNCDSIHLAYNYYDAGNSVHFYTTENFPVSQQSWTITSLTNPADSPIVILRTNPVYVFNDTGYYNVCLKAITIGGCVKEYCNIIHIETISSTCELAAYPNPAHTQVNISVQLTSPELIHAYVYDIQSILLEQINQQGSTGTNTITINTQNLTAGFYTIKLIYGNRTCFAKFQKL